MLSQVVATFLRLTILEQCIILVGCFILLILAGFYPVQSGAGIAALTAILKIINGK